MLEHDIDIAAALRHLHRPETDPHAFGRRNFLKLVGMGVGAGLVAGTGGSLLEQLLLPGHDPESWALGPVGGNDGILVLIGLYGGNDGLNTVVPFNDSEYYRQHAHLAIPGSATLPLDGSHGLHRSLTTFKSFWDAGQLAIVDGVGYPKPDLSHFSSLAHWMSGRPGQVSSSGWVGRWLDGYLDGAKDLYAAAEVGSTIPLHLVGERSRGTAVPESRPMFGVSTTADDYRLYDAIRSMRNGANGQWHSAVADAFVDHLDMSAQLGPVVPADLPEGSIVSKLEVAARLVNANLGFRVLTAGWHDFDTHARQPGIHDVRMSELDAALAKFFDLLDPAWSSRVTVMTYSEFGRTSWANDGYGTDHGSAAPHFVMGANVKGGFYGERPSLAGLGRWDRMQHTVDFRSYYASVIDGWLGGGSEAALGGTYEDLGLFRRAPGVLPNGTTAPLPSVSGEPAMFVPLAPARIADTRSGFMVPAQPLGPGDIVRVKVAGLFGVPPTGATAVVANVTAVDATSPHFFTVFPGGTSRPGTSNINGGPGRPVPNLVVMAIGADGCIEVFNSHGYTHCLVDVFGYFTPTGGDRFNALAPSRLFDSRIGHGVRPGKLAEGEILDVDVVGRSGVPVGATAVVMNLTATEPESPGFLRLTPSGEARAETSNVNFYAWDTVPNLTICKIGANGRILLDGVGAGTHVIGDVFGYFGQSGSRLQPSAPKRLIDTREGLGTDKKQLGPGQAVEITVAGRVGVPQHATAVVINVAATNVANWSYLSVWPAGQPDPGTSNLNLAPGQTVANLVICQLGDGGRLMLQNPLANCDVIVDVMGFFVA
jgi:uncharacterized protein (DUF1501 family)